MVVANTDLFGLITPWMEVSFVIPLIDIMKKLLLLPALFYTSYLLSQTTALLNNVTPDGGAVLSPRIVFALTSGQLGSTDGNNVELIPTTTVVFQGMAGKLGNVALLVCNNPTSGVELWKSDGTVAGTSLIKDINTTGSSNPQGPDNGVNIVGNVGYFTADDGINGRELWKTDGTAAGTVMVKNITPGAGSTTFAFPRVLNNEFIGNTFFFMANDGVNGLELWKTDGTDAGTSMVKNISAGNASTLFLNAFVGNGSYVFFIANDNVNGYELWRTDGTAAGTMMLQNINPTGNAFDPVAFNGQWQYFLFNNIIYFNPSTGTNSGNQLWKSDGSVAGTTLITQLNPGSNNTYTQLVHSVVIGSKFYFAADGVNSSSAQVGVELFSSDGTAAGTTLVKDIASGTTSSNLSILKPEDNWGDAHIQFLMQGKFFLTAETVANGRELWVSDGTSAGTIMLGDIRSGTGSSMSQNNTSYAHTLYKFYFAADNGTNGTEVWQTDGTPGGTSMVQDIYSGVSASDPQFYGVAVANNKLILHANNGDGIDIYRLDAAVVAFPLKLIRFSAMKNQNSVQINWTTENEVNSSHFNVQRSLDGTAFQTIGTVSATGGAFTKQYSITDVNPALADVYYYRLEIVDKDGKKVLSNVINVKLKKEVSFIVAANKSEAILTFKDISGEVSIKITDAKGSVHLVIKQKLNNGNNIRIPIQQLASGLYFITAEYNGTISTRKFIK